MAEFVRHEILARKRWRLWKWEEGAVDKGENREDDDSSGSDGNSEESRNANDSNDGVADDGCVVSGRLACIEVSFS